MFCKDFKKKVEDWQNTTFLLDFAFMVPAATPARSPNIKGAKNPLSSIHCLPIVYGMQLA
jgi:hypothetical protein